MIEIFPYIRVYFTYARSAMKRFILFARVCLLCAVAIPSGVNAQLSDPTFPNYVVIGAFAHERNAIHFTDEAKHNRYPARFELNPIRNLYYVYVLATPDREYARAEALRLRVESKYFDTWVYSGQFGNATVSDAGARESRDFNPETGEVLETVTVKSVSLQGTTQSPQDVNAIEQNDARLVKGDAPPLNTRQQVSKTAVPPEDQSGDKGRQQEQAGADIVRSTNAIVKIPHPIRQTSAPLSPEDVVGKRFYFHLFRADNHNTVPGEVDAIDFERSRKMGTYPANEGVEVVMAGGKAKHISFVCQVFGYRKLQQEFDPASPSPELYLDDKGNLVVPFELVRLQKGDIAIMYNVFFFKDAAVMRPESRYEVNNLLDLLVENPSYKIVIHGHTNGNASGKIIRMDKPGNFYALTGTKQGFGSAKQLSEERALVIRDFLITSGVSGDRMQVKAWGGKKPIHDKHSVRAHENVRVEIEILSE